ncbi:hypothetical protein SLEP1_g9821 [Rubroshorea leprosula]|uniref:Uncharacterized protein n=1 Tax=Rubroshorea leprosula TaxID=152421 RepID=A0AAV5IE24_9ROSI|nr:hypothetical protein SLEP1_g9821 [Rubroshorea leprosula]
MVRTPICDKSGLRKGTWTAEEDRKLMAYVTRYGCWNWRQLPKFAGLSRCGKSCRLRWMNYLRPNIKRGNYTREEEETILKLHESLGNKWSAIAAKLPGRTDNEIKNYWHTTLKKRLKQKPIPDDQGKEKSQSKTNTKEKETSTNNHLNGSPITPPIFESLVSSPQPTSTDQQSSTSAIAIAKSEDRDLIYDQEFTALLGESFVSSQQPTSIDQQSSTSDNAITTSDDLDMGFGEGITAWLGECEAHSGDFWTEPFLADNFHIATECESLPLVPVVDPDSDGELLCPQYYGFYDDPIACLIDQL